MALGLTEYSNELPQIARVLMVEEDLITVEWWIGSYSGTWNPWVVKSVEQTASVHKNCIVLRNVQLSRSNRLAKQTVDRLRKIYENLEFM